MKDRDKLKKLVQIIGDLLKLEGNEWLIDEILKTIGDISPIEAIAKHSVIQNINEYCVEQKIQQQATNFYKSFPIQEIKDQLIEDYKKMEHERRRDDFEGFSMSMFQQIEAIVNFCFESNYIQSNLKNDRNSSAFIEWNTNTKKWERKSSQRLVPLLLLKVNPVRNRKSPKYNPNSTASFYELDEQKENDYFENDGRPVIDYNPHKKSWSFLNRLRTVLFYYYFRKKMKQNEFDSIYNVSNEIYIIRNQNHRESKATPKQQKIIDRIHGNESKYYFKFYGFLQDFVNHVESSYSTISNSESKDKKSSKPKNQKNTIGANSPELEKIMQQLKKK